MKGFNRIGFLLAAAAAALFLPACGGGGGDRQDYYISPEQFVSGAKEFKIYGPVQFEVYVFPGAMTTPLPVSEENSSGYSVDGYAKFEGRYQVPAHIEYYVSGGETGNGHMSISFTESLTSTTQKSIAHFMGALSVADVETDATVSAEFLTPGGKRVLLYSLQGVKLRMDYNFSQGSTTATLMYTEANDDGTSQFGDVIQATYTYVAVPVGS